MKFAVEAWAPEYGSATGFDDATNDTKVNVDVTIERSAPRWSPLSPSPGVTRPETMLFTDGVRRVDASVWVTSADGKAWPGLCASYAAGAVLCDGRARIVKAEVERGLFTCAPAVEPIVGRHSTYAIRRPEDDSPVGLTLALQKRMTELEVCLAQVTPAQITIVDGPLGARHGVEATIGYVKTHHVNYLPEQVAGVIERLGTGERTPVFLIAGPWSRYSWYLRLPGATGHAWAGVVRCETTADAEPGQVVALADTVTAALPRFASAGHKDARAPQNLYPIAGLERELRRRLGDAALLYRDLRAAAALTAVAS